METNDAHIMKKLCNRLEYIVDSMRIGHLLVILKSFQKNNFISESTLKAIADSISLKLAYLEMNDLCEIAQCYADLNNQNTGLYNIISLMVVDQIYNQSKILSSESAVSLFKSLISQNHLSFQLQECITSSIITEAAPPPLGLSKIPHGKAYNILADVLIGESCHSLSNPTLLISMIHWLTGSVTVCDKIFSKNLIDESIAGLIEKPTLFQISSILRGLNSVGYENFLKKIRVFYKYYIDLEIFDFEKTNVCMDDKKIFEESKLTLNNIIKKIGEFWLPWMVLPRGGQDKNINQLYDDYLENKIELTIFKNITVNKTSVNNDETEDEMKIFDNFCLKSYISQKYNKNLEDILNKDDIMYPIQQLTFYWKYNRWLDLSSPPIVKSILHILLNYLKELTNSPNDNLTVSTLMAVSNISLILIDLPKLIVTDISSILLSQLDIEKLKKKKLSDVFNIISLIYTSVTDVTVPEDTIVEISQIIDRQLNISTNRMLELVDDFTFKEISIIGESLARILTKMSSPNTLKPLSPTTLKPLNTGFAKIVEQCIISYFDMLEMVTHSLIEDYETANSDIVKIVDSVSRIFTFFSHDNYRLPIDPMRDIVIRYIQVLTNSELAMVLESVLNIYDKIFELTNKSLDCQLDNDTLKILFSTIKEEINQRLSQRDGACWGESTEFETIAYLDMETEHKISILLDKTLDKTVKHFFNN
eukprot:GHVL01041630.1.p1 GENE.GHVL01041630.1~~GHVL01041630.1.p1  ORF type:complete len:704 (-),score=183.47 GHVL01041630.1:1632-3743(-)